jgi:hypothetical protein
MSLSLEYTNNEILNLPLSLLWNLNKPEIIDNNLYISIPLDVFFGDIYLLGINTQCNVRLIINNNTLQNYVSNFYLNCKIRIFSERARPQYIDMSDNSIQTITCLDYNTNIPRLHHIISGSNEFYGIIKGIFIESENIVSQLKEIQFCINSNLNRNYNEFLIKKETIKINDNFLYFPFNSENTYNERGFYSFNGSLYLFNDENCAFNLTFKTPTNSIKIYLLKANKFCRRNYYTPISTNYGYTGVSNFGHTGPSNYNNNYTSSSNYGLTGPFSSENNNSTLPVGQTIFHPIDPERNTCSILHEVIMESQRYMMCALCNSNFNENAIRQWLQNRSGNRRTCPTCREVWTNYNVYINTPT